jgi:hypothetical protein
MDRVKPTLQLPPIRRTMVDWGGGAHPVFWLTIAPGVAVLLPRVIPDAPA